jgi:hypothetical protein
VVKTILSSLVAAVPRWVLRGENYPVFFGCGLAAQAYCDSPFAAA